MPGKVFLHLGLPKTGTSFLQKVLQHNEAPLREHGVIFPNGKGMLMFRAMLEVTERAPNWGRSVESVQGTWQTIVEAARAHEGNTVVSNELFCLATPAQVERMLGDLAGLEVHVVLTVRDLGRQLPAEWQEGVKHGRRVGLDDFLSVVFDEPSPDPRLHNRFWSVQDPVAILQHWSPMVPPERVHLVVNPLPGTPPTLLWERFASVIDVPPAAVTMPDREVNTSLGIAQTEVLRRVNQRLDRGGNQVVYGEVVKRLYAGSILAPGSSRRAGLPERWHAAVEERAARTIDGLSARSYDVVGDLAELTPRLSGGAEQTDTSTKELLEVALDGTAGLLQEIVDLRATVAELRGKGPRRSINLLRARD